MVGSVSRILPDQREPDRVLLVVVVVMLSMLNASLADVDNGRVLGPLWDVESTRLGRFLRVLRVLSPHTCMSSARLHSVIPHIHSY